MKTKFKLSNRILSLVLAFAMALGMMPMMSMTAFAATEAPELGKDRNLITYSDGVTQYYKYNNYLYKVRYTNMTRGGLITLGFTREGDKVVLRRNDPAAYTGLYPNASCTDGEYISPDQLPKYPDGELFAYCLSAGDRNQPVVDITCVAVDVPTWNWNGTSSATATFTASDADVSATANAEISRTYIPAGNCKEQDRTAYTATVTFNGWTYTDTITEYGAYGPHSCVYSTTSKNTLTETCSVCNDHTATATLTSVNSDYTGSAITTGASVDFSDGWAGPKDYSEITYSNNIDAGDAVAEVTVAGVFKLTTTFTINPATITGDMVHLSSTSGTYNGSAYDKPDITVTFNGKPLEKDTDYTYSWDKEGFTTPGAYTVRVEGKGNFTGSVEKTFKINAASLSDIKVEQAGTLTYNGKAQAPDVSASAVAVNNQPVTFTYSTEQDGTYGAMPSFTNAGTYTVYYKATAPNHNEATGSFTVTVDKKTVTEPAIASKPYNGETQTADVPESDLYTVTENNGGKDAGKYNVVLTLKDSENYKWSTSSDPAKVTLEFEITKAENSWTAAPSITGWTYGETANTPVCEAKFGDVYVSYAGTANDGSVYNDTTPPEKAGKYRAEFYVYGTSNYDSIEKEEIDFTIEKADYDMSGARWDYNGAFDYDGESHSVLLDEDSLPAGVTVDNYTGNTASAVGKYTADVSLSYADLYNYNDPDFDKSLEWEIKNDWTPAEYVVSTPNENGWLNDEFTIIPEEGYLVSLTNTADSEWKNKLTCSDETADGSVTFYLKNEEDGRISLGKTGTYKIDKTPATGRVEFDERTGWEEFLNTISFGLFYKNEVTVKITADDTLSGVANIEYYEADKAMTLDEVKALANWTVYNGSFGVSVEDAKQFVYFIRITDIAGNVTYLSTDGAEYDTTAPVISGIENGRIYYTTQKVSVTEKNVASIMLNGEDAGADITLDGNRDAAYTIAVTDKAGNSTTVTVTMKPIEEVAAATEGLSTGNVTSANKQAMEDLAAKLDELLADDDVTDDEHEILEQYKAIAESLLKTIEDAAEAITSENIEKVKDITAENVTSENKTDLEKAKEELEQALENYAGNYTDDEKKAIEDEIKRIGDALEVIKNVEGIEGSSGKLPENITRNDEGESKAADANSPQTGDNSHMMLWIALLFISGGGTVITLTVYDRKNKPN